MWCFAERANRKIWQLSRAERRLNILREFIMFINHWCESLCLIYISISIRLPRYKNFAQCSMCFHIKRRHTTLLWYTLHSAQLTLDYIHIIYDNFIVRMKWKVTNKIKSKWKEKNNNKTNKQTIISAIWRAETFASRKKLLDYEFCVYANEQAAQTIDRAFCIVEIQRRKWRQRQRWQRIFLFDWFLSICVRSLFVARLVVSCVHCRFSSIFLFVFFFWSACVGLL